MLDVLASEVVKLGKLWAADSNVSGKICSMYKTF